MRAGQIASLRRHRKDPKLFQDLGCSLPVQDGLRFLLERRSKRRRRLLRGHSNDIGVAVARPLILGGLEDFYAGESSVYKSSQKRLF